MLWRFGRGFLSEDLAMVARSIAYCWVVALFPTLAALVSLYGLFADPSLARSHLALLDGVVPADVLMLIGDEMVRLAQQQQTSLGAAFALSLFLAVLTANTGTKALIRGLNIAYLELEGRGVVRLNKVSLGITLGGFAFAILAGAGLVVAPAAFAILRLPEGWAPLALLRWPALGVLAAVAFCLLYRAAPDRRPARWRWVSWGSTLAAAAWLGMSAAVSWYVGAFAGFTAAYGSVAAVFGFLLWSWLSALAILLGAKLNAEMEHQTAVDSTLPPNRPLGFRGAEVADTVGAARHDAIPPLDAGQIARRARRRRRGNA
ncbi:YihY/virulence factor BrkB family protein [Phenylobacterium sp.]|uniref:YihY/virulence factor BrkB family protein n=1 Tax=Phenylobacterium sp. TaxID=1871053 RepID=UPI002F955300